MGFLKAIWIKRAHGGPMDAVERATLRAGKGIVGSADRGGLRQVTLVSDEAWATTTAPLGVVVDPKVRRANLLVGGIVFADSRERILRVGNCRLKIRGETRPCEQMESAQPGLRQAMRAPWAGGVFAEVLDDGDIQLGAPVEWCDGANDSSR
jgi:MOSC domain-containing protein YiiM